MVFNLSTEYRLMKEKQKMICIGYTQYIDIINKGDNIMKNNSKNNIDPLSIELKIACEIYRCNKNNIQCPTERLNIFFKQLGYTKKRVLQSIDTLFDWGIIRCEQDPDLENRIYFITNETKPLIKSLYKKYWKDRRKISIYKNIK
jgi:hypothetical protein